MEITFVGTGAADYEAAFTCDCANCRGARERGGPNIRTYASIAVNGVVLVDCGPTVAWRLAECDVAPRAITDILFTHAHSDHADVAAIGALAGCRGREAPLRVHGNAATCELLREAKLDVERNLLLPGDRADVTGMEVIALPARHDLENQVPLTYAISDGTAWLLYATDTAWPPDGWWQLLEGRKLDAVMLEATFGLMGPDVHGDCLTNHLNWAEAERLREELGRRGYLTAGCQSFATHLSQHFVPIHEELCLQVSDCALRPAYDGLRVRVGQ